LTTLIPNHALGGQPAALNHAAGTIRETLPIRLVNSRWSRFGVRAMYSQWRSRTPAGANLSNRSDGYGEVQPADVFMHRIGKKLAGGLLDGKLHHDYPASEHKKKAELTHTMN
jgi:hypothetical protein